MKKTGVRVSLACAGNEGRAVRFPAASSGGAGLGGGFACRGTDTDARRFRSAAPEVCCPGKIGTPACFSWGSAWLSPGHRRGPTFLCAAIASLTLAPHLGRVGPPGRVSRRPFEWSSLTRALDPTRRAAA
jgi:hypothetical protein